MEDTVHPTTIRLPEDKLARLDALAKTMRRSRNEALNEAIDNYPEVDLIPEDRKSVV